MSHDTNRNLVCGKRSYALVVTLCLSLTAGSTMAGCGSSVDTDSPDDISSSFPAASDRLSVAEEDSIFDFVSRIDRESFRRAFSQLDERTFTQTTRTTQFDEEGRRIAFEEHVVRYLGLLSNRRFETINRESDGEFDFGYLRRFVSGSADFRLPADLTGLILSDDAAYLSPRNREAFSYGLLPDTSLWDAPVRIIEIRARPKLGDAQDVRRVRLYVNRNSNRLVGHYLERVDRALWFREASIFYAWVRPASDGSWLPHHTRFETRVVVPFRPAQRFRTESTYGWWDVGTPQNMGTSRRMEVRTLGRWDVWKSERWDVGTYGSQNVGTRGLGGREAGVVEEEAGARVIAGACDLLAHVEEILVAERRRPRPEIYAGIAGLMT